jgi:TP901 family phage tail tape measure protein
MGDTIRAGVALSLKGDFSAGIKKAGADAKGFGDGVSASLKKVDGVLSGVSSKIAALGISIGAAAAVKNTIDFDDKMTRLGITADISAERVDALKKKMWETAQAPDIKINVDSLNEAMDQVLERTGDIEFAESNLRAMGLAIQATGASGADIGGLFAEFQKMKLGADDAMKSLDLLTLQGKAGAFTLENLASLGPRTISAYSATGRSGSQALREMGAALQVIRMGTGSSEQAATAFEAVFTDLRNPQNQKDLAKLGVSLKDRSGNFRSIADIMKDIVVLSKGNENIIGSMFGSEAMRAFNTLIGEYKKTGSITSLQKFLDLQSDGTTILKDSARAANDAKSNIENLQTAFYRFADSKLTGPLSKVTDGLNQLAEDPDKFQRVFTGIAIGLGAIVAVKGLATVTTLIGNIKGLRGGKVGIDVAGAGGAGMPVFVTNWGGSGVTAGAFANTAPEVWKDTGASLSKNSNWIPSGTGKAALAGMGLAALVAVPQTISEIRAIKADTELSNHDRATRSGAAVGGAIGTVAGAGAGIAVSAIAGAKLGALIGTALGPGIGTAIGGVLGAGAGTLVGIAMAKAGREAGGYIGGKLGDSAESKRLSDVRSFSARTGISAADLERANVASRQYAAASLRAPLPQASRQEAILTGNAEMLVRVVSDVPVTASVVSTRNSIAGMTVNTGNIREARANQ